MEGFKGFPIGPNWHYGPAETDASGLRTVPVLCEDVRAGTELELVGYVAEYDFQPGPFRVARWRARSLDGWVGPIRPTGPSHPLEDLALHLGLLRY